MDQIFPFILMILVIALFIYCSIKLSLKLNKPKELDKASGIVISKSSSIANEFSISKGYMEDKELYCI